MPLKALTPIGSQRQPQRSERGRIKRRVATLALVAHCASLFDHLNTSLRLSIFLLFFFFLLLWTPPPRLLSPAIPWELISFLALLPHSLCASKAEPDVCFFIFVSCVAIGFAWFHSSLILARCKRRGHSERSRRPVFWNLIGCWQLRPQECQQDFFICARNSFWLVLLLWRYASFYINPSCYSYLTILL